MDDDMSDAEEGSRRNLDIEDGRELDGGRRSRGRGEHGGEEEFELEDLTHSSSPGYHSPRTEDEPESARHLMWPTSPVASSSRSRT